MSQQFASFAERHGLGEAVRFTSTTAADVLGETNLGRIAVGARANLVGLNSHYQPVRVIVDGADIPLS